MEKWELSLYSIINRKLILLKLAALLTLICCCSSSTLCFADSRATSSLHMNSSIQKKDTVIGAWAPSNFRLEKMQDPKQVNKAILNLLQQGFREYYFVMRDFNNASEVKATEQLLKAADKTDLKIVISLLPPSESGNYGAYSNADYDWKGWIAYFNSLKTLHPISFLGFVIDDFNAVDGIRRLYVMNNINYFMGSSNLSAALFNKRNDVQFYPVMYLETGGFETLKKNYGKFLSGIILASTSAMSPSSLSPNDQTQLNVETKALSKMFEDKPLKYILYPITTQNDMLLNRHMADALSTASRFFNYIIIYVKTDDSIIQDFLHSSQNTVHANVNDSYNRNDYQIKRNIDHG